MDAVLSGFVEIIRGGVIGSVLGFVCLVGQELCRSQQQVRTTSVIWAFCIALTGWCSRLRRRPAAVAVWGR